MHETNSLIAQRQTELKALTQRGLNPFTQECFREVILASQAQPLPTPPANH